MSILIAAVWRWRRLIGLATLMGAVVGVMIALATPHKYYGESRLFVDPREVRVTEDDVRNQQLSTEAMLAIIDSQLQILSSTSVLESVIAELGLAQDPEFNVALSSGGVGAGIGLIKEILTGRDPMSDAQQQALEYLRNALSVSRDTMTFVIIVGVETRDPEKTALIANTIVQTYLDEEGEAQSDLLERTSDAIDTRINALRQDLDEAERAVEQFKAENGIVGVGGGQSIDDQEILAISEQLANARAVKVGVRVKAENLARTNPEDVLAGSFPEEFLSSNLVDLRKQYTQTKSTADSLATRLGPRHPQYVSAKQSLDTIRSEITRELRRIVASSQSELQRAVETEQELSSQMAVAKSRAMDQSVEFVTLRELERKATATREIYEAFLRRSRETSERSNLSTRNVRVISPAEAPLSPMGPSRKFIAIGGMMAGFFAGLGLALVAGALESIRAYTAAGSASGTQSRTSVPPYGGHPVPPAPAPQTPPPGPQQDSRASHWPGSESLGMNRSTGYTGGGQPRGAGEGGAQAAHPEPGFAAAPATGPAAGDPVREPAGRVENWAEDRSAGPAAPAFMSAIPASGMHQPPFQQPVYPQYPHQRPEHPAYPPYGYPQSGVMARHPVAPLQPAYPEMSPYAGHPPAFAPHQPHVMPGQYQGGQYPGNQYPEGQHPGHWNPAYRQPAPHPGHYHVAYHPATVYPQPAPPMQQPHQEAPAAPLRHAAHPAAAPGYHPSVQPPQGHAAYSAGRSDPRDPTVDRIRREMDQLRVRIGQQSGLRRRA